MSTQSQAEGVGPVTFWFYRAGEVLGGYSVLDPVLLEGKLDQAQKWEGPREKNGAVRVQLQGWTQVWNLTRFRKWLKKNGGKE